MKGILIKTEKGWSVHALGSDPNHASQIFKLSKESVLSQEILRAWINNQHRTIVNFEILDGFAHIEDPATKDITPFNPETSKHEVFSIQGKEALIGFRTKNNSFHFTQVPYTDPTGSTLEQLWLLNWLEEKDYLTDKASVIWEEFIKTR